MIKAIHFKLAWDINITFCNHRRPSKSEAQALVQGIDMPKDNLLLPRNQRRVVSERLCSMVTTCLA